MSVAESNIVGMIQNGLIVIRKKITGPSSYSAGGFTITVNEVSKIYAAAITATKLPDTAKIVYKIDMSISGNQITFVVKQIDVTSTSANWTEVSNGTDLSGLEIELLVIGG